MTWTIPEGLSALYLGFDWDQTVILCIYRGTPTGTRTHELEEAHVGAVLYAMGQTDDKRTLFENMVKNGVIRKVVDPCEKAFCDLLRAHDWTYQMSDDGKAFRRGEEQEATIKRAIMAFPDYSHFQALYDAYLAWVWKKGPKPELPA